MVHLFRASCSPSIPVLSSSEHKRKERSTGYSKNKVMIHDPESFSPSQTCLWKFLARFILRMPLSAVQLWATSHVEACTRRPNNRAFGAPWRSQMFSNVFKKGGTSSSFKGVLFGSAWRFLRILKCFQKIFLCNSFVFTFKFLSKTKALSKARVHFSSLQLSLVSTRALRHSALSTCISRPID